MRIELLSHTIEIDESRIEADKAETREQIEEYASGNRKEFRLEVEFPDSFLGRMMEEMNKIPYGETRTYSEIAENLNTAPIAVGQACSRNPLPVIVPCHRVVGKNSVGGYRYGRELKEKLLALESEN